MTDRIKEMRVRYRTYTSHGWRWYLLDRLEAAEARAEAADKRWQALRDRLVADGATETFEPPNAVARALADILDEMDRLEAEGGRR